MPAAVALSFDVEEFDLPLEYGVAIDEAEQYRVGAEGLVVVLDMLDALGATATFFCTGAFARRRPDLIARIVTRHELASHGMNHSGFEPADLLASRELLESIGGVRVAGFRMARMAPVDTNAIRNAGYTYNASENPIWLPGRYNKFFAPRRPYVREGLVQIPAGTSPLVRWPLFWLAFKNAPVACSRLATRWALAWDGETNLYFHPWEFAALDRFAVPGFIRRPDGTAMRDRLFEYLQWLMKRAELITMNTIAERTRAAAGASA
ncbi:MAG: polysaccharide deacetylase family protein [Planctomycetota bacterium]|nr:polysaccharide deacetylase family protein [Planctomycetota bacterium]